MNNVEFVRELEFKDNGVSGPGRACLVKMGEDYFRVSSVDAAFDTGLPETLVFPCGEDGEPKEWHDVAGGSNVSREEAIRELETGERSPRPGLFGALLDALEGIEE